MRFLHVPSLSRSRGSMSMPTMTPSAFFAIPAQADAVQWEHGWGP